jgi:hypothetical protein
MLNGEQQTYLLDQQKFYESTIRILPFVFSGGMNEKKRTSSVDSELAPPECQKHACAIQTCIAKNQHAADPVQYCQSYFDTYKQCIERRDNLKHSRTIVHPASGPKSPI